MDFYRKKEHILAKIVSRSILYFFVFFFNFLIYLDVHLLLGSWFGVWTGLDSQMQNGYCVIVFLPVSELEPGARAPPPLAPRPFPKTKTTTNGHVARISARPRASSLLLAPRPPRLHFALVSYRCYREERCRSDSGNPPTRTSAKTTRTRRSS